MAAMNRLRAALGEHNFFGFRWIIEKFNDYDVLRFKEIGADRLAAEWILRCGGAVRFDRYKDLLIEDYNSLVMKTAVIDPRVPAEQVYLTHAHAIKSCVTARGCRHFEGLTRLQDVRFTSCKNLEDEGLKTLAKTVGPQLLSAEVSSCRYITEDGIKAFGECSQLKSLVLADLVRVRQPRKLLDYLKERLPEECEIFYDEVTTRM